MTMVTVTSGIEAEANKIAAVQTHIEKYYIGHTPNAEVQVTVVVEGVTLQDTVDFGMDRDAAEEWCDIVKDDVKRAKEKDAR